MVQIFLVLLSVLLGANAFAAEAKSYVHLRATADTFQDIAPRLNGKPLPDKVAMGKTKFNATVNFYFVPGDQSAPAFVEAKYNLRRANHQWFIAVTGMRPVGYYSSAKYETLAEVVRAQGEIMTAARGAEMDFSEPSFPPNTVIAMAVGHGFGDLDPSALEATQAFLSGERATGERKADELSLGIPEQQFLKPEGTFPVQFRIAYEHYNFDNRAQTIISRRMLWGQAQILPMDPAHLHMIERLLTLQECQSDLEQPGKAH